MLHLHKLFALLALVLMLALAGCTALVPVASASADPNHNPAYVTSGGYGFSQTFESSMDAEPSKAMPANGLPLDVAEIFNRLMLDNDRVHDDGAR
jgi:hypothetical protein